MERIFTTFVPPIYLKCQDKKATINPTYQQRQEDLINLVQTRGSYFPYLQQNDGPSWKRDGERNLKFFHAYAFAKSSDDHTNALHVR